MKSFKYIFLSLLLMAVFSACEDDNYDGPKETFRGAFIDKDTGEPFQTEVGNNGIRIKMMEYSWSETPEPYYMNCRMDGTFNNTKIFAGRYGIIPEGAFVPLEEQIVDIKGTREMTFEVDPLLRVEWVGEPVLNADGTVDVQVKVLRGTSDPAYQQPLAEAWLFVSETQYVGDFSHSKNNYSTWIKPEIIGAVQFGQVYTIRTGQPSGYTPGGAATPFPKYSRKFFLRFGARTTDRFSGFTRYNYTTAKEITTIARDA